jgi:hypothetical protein
MTLTEGRTALVVTHRPEQTPDLPQIRLANVNVPPTRVVRPVGITS